MDKITKTFDFLLATSTTVSVTTFVTSVNAILTLIASLVAITCGVVSIILKFKVYTKDGKLSDEEVADLQNEVEKLRKLIKKDGNEL